MVGPRAALAVAAVVAAGLVVLSGGSGADPRTPAALPGMPAPFLGTAAVGSGGLAAAVDAYGDVVDMRAPGPAGSGLIDNPADRQAAGSVSPRTGIVPRVRIGGRAPLPMWRADSVAQRYLAGTNVVRTTATFTGPGQAGTVRVAITDAARGQELALLVRLDGPAEARLAPSLSVDLDPDAPTECHEEGRERTVALVCASSSPETRTVRGRDVGSGGARRPVLAEAAQAIAEASADDRRWLSRARPLGPGAPAWARRMYGRSLLSLRALTDHRTGAVAAGVRDGWAYVWPRDAATAALALAASGYRAQARRVAGFLLGLDLGAAARFRGDGAPVPGRAAQGDAAGWVSAAAHATSLDADRALGPSQPPPIAGASDYQEGPPGTYLANAIAAATTTAADGTKTDAYRVKSARRRGGVAIARTFGVAGGLARQAGDPGSGLDSAAAWAVRPFPRPALFPLVRSTLLRLAEDRTRFGIAPGEGWPGTDPWTAPTAWSAWSLAALGERRQALRLLADLRRASTPAGDLPERLDARTGIPRSTTPLAWSHAFAILALRQLWP